MAAASAAIDMSAQSSGPAANDGAHHLELLIADPGPVLIDEAVASSAENVGHLKGGPVHDRGWRRARLTASGLTTAIDSSGLEAACRWRCDRCR